MNRWIILLLIASLFLAAAAGCGGDSEDVRETAEDRIEDIIDDDKETVDEASETGVDDQLEDVDDFFNFNTVLDLAAEFKELGWDYMGEKVDYIFQGQDTVNGENAEYIVVKTGGTAFDIWVSPDGEILKAAADGQELPPEMAQYSQYMFSLLEIFVDEQQWDRKWADGEQTSVTRDLGAGPVDITRYDWRIAAMPVYIEVDVAEIAGRNLIVKLWQYANDDTPISGWELYRVIPR